MRNCCIVSISKSQTLSNYLYLYINVARHLNNSAVIQRKHRPLYAKHIHLSLLSTFAVLYLYIDVRMGSVCALPNMVNGALQFMSKVKGPVFN
jgi:hypothetical protein